MNTSGFFAKTFVIPIANLLVLFYKLFLLLHLPYAFGFAIIGLTVFVRVILYPFVSSQIRTSEKMKRIAPHVKYLQEKHKADKKRQQEELAKLYKEHKVNPAAGCLTALIQIPVIWSLYSVLFNAVSLNSLSAIQKINNILYFGFLRLEKVWDTDFFGLPLFSTPKNLFSHAPLIVLIPVLTGVLQFILSKMMMSSDNKNAIVPAEKDKENKDDFQSAFQTQSMFIFPAMIGIFSFTLPIGLSLYWNTFSIFGILQQYFIAGWGGMRPIFERVSKSWKK